MDSGNTPQIGPALQRERKLKGLTLEQLAALSGVSKSMLSQVERGQANPTFAVLWSLTRALRIGFSELLAEATLAREDEAIELVSTAATPEMRGAEGQWRLRILSPPHFAGNTEWYELEIAPGGVLESSPHASGAVEHLTALTPGLAVKSGRSLQSLKLGETVRYPADVPHEIGNTTSRTAKGLLVVLYR
jgi:transcriptional regulator with XRE-family HTH domain